MEGPVSRVPAYADDDALKSLLEAFGSLFSLEQIASAYCKAGRDADVAGQILCNKRENASTSSTCGSKTMGNSTEFPVPLPTNTSEKSFCQNGKFRGSRKMYRAVSGSVSSLLGKNYVNPAPKANGCDTSAKSLILDESVFPTSILWGDANENNHTKSNDPVHEKMEDFLFQMLGDGFQLERDMIRQVLGKCGYDMKKSMGELIDLSTEVLAGRKKHLGKSTETVKDASLKSEELSYEKGLQARDSPRCTANVPIINKEILPQPIEERDIGREVLVSLFSASDKTEESPKGKARAMRASRVLGRPVSRPLRDIDFTSESKEAPVNSQQDVENDVGDAEEDDYQRLREAVKEHRATMKEYYKAAVDAFTMGDFDRANKLKEQGHFFHQKASEADKESSQKIFETRHRDTQNEMLLELNEFGTKEAVRLLRCHLSSLSGIPSIKYLKVIIESKEEDETKGARRRLVKKVLDKESIPWTEGEDGRSIVIRTDEIDHSRLSFAKKT